MTRKHRFGKPGHVEDDAQRIKQEHQADSQVNDRRRIDTADEIHGENDGGVNCRKHAARSRQREECHAIRAEFWRIEKIEPRKYQRNRTEKRDQSQVKESLPEVTREREVDGGNKTRDQQRTDGKIIQKHGRLVEALRNAAHEMIQSAEDKNHEVCDDEDEEDQSVMEHRRDDVRVEIDGANGNDPKRNEVTQNISCFVVKLEKT